MRAALGLIISILIGLSAILASPAQASLCKNMMAKLSKPARKFVLINGIAVTGDDFHPLHIIIQGLNFTPSEIENLKGKKLLSLGEGLSHLVPYLLQSGVNAQGLDVWYDSLDLPLNQMGDRMRAYISEYRAHLITGDATKTNLLPESYDEIVSYGLIENLEFAKKMAALQETISLLKVNGEGRIFGFEARHLPELRRFFDTVYGSSIAYTLTTINQQYELDGQLFRKSGVLVVIHKLAPVSPNAYLPGAIQPKPRSLKKPNPTGFSYKI